MARMNDMMATVRTRNRSLQSESLDTAALTNATWDNFNANEASPLVALDSPNPGTTSTSVETVDASFVTTRLWVAGSIGIVLLLIVMTICRRLVSERALANEDAATTTPKKDSNDADIEQGQVLKKVLSNESTVVLSPTISNEEDDDMTASETSHNGNSVSTGSSSKRSTNSTDGTATVVTSWPPSSSSRDPTAPPPHRLYRMDSFVQALQLDRQQRLQEEKERRVRQRPDASVLDNDDDDDEHVVVTESKATLANVQ
jgi:hypothetical protein